MNAANNLEALQRMPTLVVYSAGTFVIHLHRSWLQLHVLVCFVIFLWLSHSVLTCSQEL